jgi:hypothetical protein
MAERQRDLEKERCWREVLARQASSGLSGRAFCRQEQLAESAFYAWRRTIGQRDVQRASAKACPAFVPVAVTGSPRAGFVLELAGGRVLRLPETIPIERLAEFVVALESRGGR